MDETEAGLSQFAHLWEVEDSPDKNYWPEHPDPLPPSLRTAARAEVQAR